MTLPNNNNPFFVSLVGATGFVQNYIDYASDGVQLLISLMTLLYVFQKWRNEKKKAN